MKALPVYERFHSWQGEGVHLGKSAFFIRLHGCPVHCPWCDSAGTWHPDHLPEKVDRIEPDELADEAFSSGCEIVVITGGEPAIHNLHDLAYQLRNRSLPVHLETCGRRQENPRVRTGRGRPFGHSRFWRTGSRNCQRRHPIPQTSEDLVHGSRQSLGNGCPAIARRSGIPEIELILFERLAPEMT